MRTEDDIRAAFRSLAREAPDPDAVLTGVLDRLDSATAGRRRGLRTPMAALASALAVVAVIGVSVTLAVGGHVHHPAPSSGPGPDGAPRYYLALVVSGNPRSFAVQRRAVVKDTATGKTLAKVSAPRPFGTFVMVAGAPDDRTFVLAAQRAQVSGDSLPTILFLARFDPSRRKITLTRLSIPAIPWNVRLNSLALSSGDRRLAVSTTRFKGGQSQQLSVYSIGSGAVKVWRQPRGGPAYRLSFGGGGTLAYNWDAAPHHGVWLLNTTQAGGGSIINDSRFAVTMPQGWGFGDGALLTTDGSRVVAAEQRIPGNLRRHRTNLQFVEFSAATGRLTQVLWPQHAPTEALFWTSPSGTVLVVEATQKGGRDTLFGVLKGSRLMPIPGPSGVVAFDSESIAF